MKKRTALSLATILTMSTLLSACGSSDSGSTESTTTEGETTETTTEGEATTEKSSEGVTITLYEHNGAIILGDEKTDADGNTTRDMSTAYLAHLAESFEAETGIHVELISHAGVDTILPMLKVGDASVDIFSYGGSTLTMEEFQAYVEPGLTLEEANTMFGSEEVYQSIPKDETGLYLWPMAKSYNNGVVYNEEVLKSVGYDAVPETYEEFIVMCEKIRDAGITPIALHRVENWPLSTIATFADYINGEAGSLTKLLKAEKPFSDETAIGQMLRIYAEMKSKKLFEQEVYVDFGVPMNYVAEGKAAMMLFGSWVVPQIQSRVPEGGDPSAIKFDAAVDYGNGRYIALEPGWSYGINKASDNIEECKLFLDYISKDAEMYAKGGSIVLRTDVEAIVPELYQIIDDKVEAGTVTAIPAVAQDENYLNADAVLNEADLKVDEKWAGGPFDAIDMANPEDFTAYDTQIEKQNEYYKDAQDFLGVEYID